MLPVTGVAPGPERQGEIQADLRAASLDPRAPKPGTFCRQVTAVGSGAGQRSASQLSVGPSNSEGFNP